MQKAAHRDRQDVRILHEKVLRVDESSRLPIFGALNSHFGSRFVVVADLLLGGRRWIFHLPKRRRI